MKTRVLLFLVAGVLLCAGIAGNTVAWLFSKVFVKNTFVIGDISISLTETTGDEYKLIPGVSIAKDPTVTIHSGSESCWVFIKIEESGNLGDYVTYSLAEGWSELEDDVYYREYTIRHENVVYPVLKNNSITVKDTVTESEENYLKEEGITPGLKFTAYAVQRVGFDLAYDAWQEAKKQ